MAVRAESSSARQLYLYFGILTFLIFLDTPEILLDIPTSYILKDHLRATASQVSMFRLLTGIPLYIGFAFGLVRDLWNPFGWRDPGYFRIFVPLTVCAYAWMALSHLSYSGLLAGMILAMLSSRFVMSAYQGLIALLAQETLMSGRLSALFNIFNFAPQVAVTFASGYVAEHLSPRQTFSLAIALTLPIGLFGFWKPRSVFNQTYEDPRALGTNFAGDVKRLVKHWAIYPAVLINFLWTFNPGFNTPLQFYLSERLHASDAAYSNYLGIYFAAYLPTMLLYGFLCTKMPARKLLWWSAIIGVPQMAPLAFVHSAHLALVIAVPMGLLGGLASAAFIDLAMRSCPPGLQGTLMMLIQSVMMFSLRGSDVLGSWIYGLSRDNGFLYCVTATTVVYALILPAILLVPKELIATADGEPNPALEAAVIAEIGEAGSAV